MLCVAVPSSSCLPLHCEVHWPLLFSKSVTYFDSNVALCRRNWFFLRLEFYCFLFEKYPRHQNSLFVLYQNQNEGCASDCKLNLLSLWSESNFLKDGEAENIKLTNPAEHWDLIMLEPFFLLGVKFFMVVLILFICLDCIQDGPYKARSIESLPCCWFSSTTGLLW